MAEYIERESLVRQIICNMAEFVGSPDEVQRHDEYCNYAINIIEDAPAADVAPVVRCRDCKHAWIHPCGYVYCHRDGRNAYEMTFNLDSFCIYGERKDNG